MKNESIITLEKICDELSDGLHKAPIFNPKGEYLFVNALNLKNGFIVDNNDGKRSDKSEFEKYKIDLNENTILYSIDGTIGNIAKYRGEKCILGKGACYLKVNPKYNSDYIYYVLQSQHFQDYIKAMSTGSTIHHISLYTMRKYSFCLPSREKQNAIATVLKSIDEKISLNKKINATLEAMAKTLYDYWFVQFDFPDENGNPYKSSGGKMIFNAELGREIPIGWEICKLENLLVKNSNPFDYQSNEPTIDLSVMPSNSISLDELNCSDNFSTNLFKMCEGDILFGSIRPYLKKAGIAPCDGVFAGTIHSYRAKKTSDYNFALFTLCNDNFFDYAVKVATGTKMPVIRNEDVLSYKVAYSKEIAKKFNELELKKVVCKNNQENQSLANLRNFILPLLMNGQVEFTEE